MLKGLKTLPRKLVVPVVYQTMLLLTVRSTSLRPPEADVELDPVGESQSFVSLEAQRLISEIEESAGQKIALLPKKEIDKYLAELSQFGLTQAAKSVIGVSATRSESISSLASLRKEFGSLGSTLPVQKGES